MVECAERERRDVDAFHILAQVDLRGRCISAAARQQEANRLRRQSTDGKAEQERGFSIEPLHVVDGDKERST
jgi:hypothetical protein